jgi:hypothetical protein
LFRFWRAFDQNLTYLIQIWTTRGAVQRPRRLASLAAQ